MSIPFPITHWQPAFPAGMIARWTLDDTSAGYIDLIGGRVLTPLGTGVTAGVGVIGNAFGKTSADGYLTRAGVALTGTFAIEAWSYYAGQDYIITQWPQTGVGEWSLDTYGTSGRVRFFVQDGFSTAIVTGTSAGATGVWRQIVGVYDGTAALASRLRIYSNGILEATGAVQAAAAISGNAPLWLARRGPSASSTAQRIDEPAIWQFGASGDPGAAFWLNRYNGGAGVRP